MNEKKMVLIVKNCTVELAMKIQALINEHNEGKDHE